MIPKLIIHGGCGKFEGNHASIDQYDQALREILRRSYRKLLKKSAREVCVFGMRLLEDEPMFNAGYGSKLQSDGTVRMSAAFMDGYKGKFSGVINVEDVQHPVEIARILNNRKHTVIAGRPAVKFARREKIPKFDPVAPHRLEEHESMKEGETGTCGIVALDCNGRICVATSTGGIGYEVPGRVGDTPTVAGTYANKHCGVSCTGIGEHIINLAVASKIASKVEDGMPLSDAVNGVIAQGNLVKSRFGLIALDAMGQIVMGQTRQVTTLAAWHDGVDERTFAD